jgi:hypothetical protein
VKRLPAIAFGAMVAATIFAFFLTQAIKTNSTLVHGTPHPIPAAFNPVSGRSCRSKTGSMLSYRHTTLSLQPYQAGTVGMYVLDNAGDVVATLSEGRYLSNKRPTIFVWRGFENGGSLAPDGVYFFQAVLVKQDRAIDLKQSPITVMTHDPHAPATSVALTGTAAPTTVPVKTGVRVKPTGPAVLTPPAGSVTVHFKAGAVAYRRAWMNVYRSNASGHLKRVYRFSVKPTQDTATWSGNLAGDVPAPAGTYLIGIMVQDPACNPGTYPSTLSPSPGSTPDAGVTVRYLAATPPLAPTPAGSRATVEVESPTGPYTWALRLAGSGHVLAHGQAAGSTGSGDVTLKVRMPENDAGLYTLTLSAGQYSTAVPLVASATGARAARDRVLVVLPMLTWQGQNPVDDTGDGLPDTLSAGDQISLERPLAQGLPVGLEQDSALLAYLKSQSYHFQLTTDVALAEGVGPSLSGNEGVVLAGSETWLPGPLVSVLKGFVRAGGTLLSLGADSLTARSEISGYPSDPVASAPERIAADLFGATASVAGITDVSPAVTARNLGKGYVFEVGLPDFNSTLAASVDSQELLSRVWQLLAK